jgi:hypothetical protein
LSSNTENDLDTNVVRALMQPEGCGPAESALTRTWGTEVPTFLSQNGLLASTDLCSTLPVNPEREWPIDGHEMRTWSVHRQFCVANQSRIV